MKRTLHLFYSGAFTAILFVLLGFGNGGVHLQGKANPIVGKESINSVADPDITSPDITETSNVLVGAGDIANCNTSSDSATATLLDSITGTVFTLGDNVYPDGTAKEFQDCYEPTWGRHKARTMPASGNHDYHVAGAAAYYDYFGASAGDSTKGYYSYDLANWHIVVLNSECSQVGGCTRTSAQGKWLEADLAAHPSACLLAYWHKPRFSSGAHGNNGSFSDFWNLLYAAGAEVILNGHDHVYERFALQDANGVADPAGIRQFTVGTGGTTLVPFISLVANSEVRSDQSYGVLKLTLHADRYDWQFVPIAGTSFSDSGSDSCRGQTTATATPDPASSTTPTATNTPATTPSATAPATATAIVPTQTATGTPPALCPVGAQTVTFSQRITQGKDDAEESLNNGTVDIASTDLELINDGGAVPQIVGMRFPSVTIPRGVQIANAYIEFEVDEADTGATSLVFHAQAEDNPPTFASATINISARSRTAASVAWNSLPAWTQLDAKQQTPNLAAIVQELVDRSGWTTGNAMVFLATGNGERTAESVDGEPAAAPLLVVQYCTQTNAATPTATQSITPIQTPTSTPIPSGTPPASTNKAYLPLVTK